MALSPRSVDVTVSAGRRVPVPTSVRTQARPALAAIGDVILEVVASAEQALEDGSDVPGTVRVRRGGSAANVCAAFARLGGRSVFMGSVGRDRAGREVIDALRGEGVEAHAVRVDVPTARLLALVAPDGERSFVTQRSAADRLRADDLSARWLRGVDVLHVPGYSLYNQPLVQAALRAIELARTRGALVSVDLSSRVPLLGFGRQRMRDLLAGMRPDVLFANASEAAALFPRSHPSRLLEVAEVAVVKQGRAGAQLVWSSAGEAQQIEVAAPAIKATDTTGAGDAFAAGFLYSLLAESVLATLDRPAASGRRSPRSPAVLRRAALAGHRSAAVLLRSQREEIAL
jgi:sugar/nucleoside kinase (ribokinase family)